MNQRTVYRKNNIKLKMGLLNNPGPDDYIFNDYYTVHKELFLTNGISLHHRFSLNHINDIKSQWRLAELLSSLLLFLYTSQISARAEKRGFIGG